MRAAPETVVRPEAEVTFPHPPRMWWFKRLTAAVVVALVLLTALRLWWGWEANRRLRRALNAMAARGEPTRLDDVKPPDLPDAHNSAAYFQKAVARVNGAAISPANSQLDVPAYPPLGAQWDSMAAQSVAANTAVFPLARQARAYDQFNWGTRLVSPAPMTLLPHINNARMLANALADGAEYAHFHGDEVAAIETFRDVRHLARAAGTEPFLVCFLVGTGIDALTTARIQEIAPDLAIAAEDGPPPPPPPPRESEPLPAGPYPAARPPKRAATASHVRLLIAELLDEKRHIESFKYGLGGEWIMAIDTADWLAQRAPLLRPMFELDVLRTVAPAQVWRRAAEQPTLPAAKALLATSVVGPAPGGQTASATLFGGMTSTKATPSAPDYARVISSTFPTAFTGIGRSFEYAFRLRLARRMAAVSLAAQLFRHDRHRWPGALDELVPRYLPAVPTDLYDPTAAPLRYLPGKGVLPDGGDRPVVYSVGENGVDDSTTGAYRPDTPCFGWQNKALDQWLDLARWAPPPPATAPSSQPASTQAADDQPQKPDHPR